MPKVLFVGYGGGHMAMLLPVMRALRQRLPSVRCQLLALTTGQALARAAGEQPLGYSDFMHLVDARSALAWGERMHAGTGSPDVPREESLAYLGINYLDLVAQHGEAGAAELYMRRGRLAFLPLHFMQRLLDELAPDAVVATNSPRSEQAALQAAVECGIPSIGMVDLFGLDSDGYVLRAVRPHRTCVLAESVRQRLLARGFGPADVVVTGNPAFDGLFAPANQALAGEFIHRQGWQGLAPVLWAGQSESIGGGPPQPHPDIGLATRVESALRALVARRADLALIVRYHPAEWHLFPRGDGQARVHFSIPPREPIHPLVLSARAVVVQNSTVGLEAAVAGRPVVSMEQSASARELLSLARMGVSTACHCEADLPAVLEELLAAPDEGRARVFASDGRAAHRVAAVVEQALDQGP